MTSKKKRPKTVSERDLPRRKLAGIGIVGAVALAAGMLCAAPAISQPGSASSRAPDRHADWPAPTRVNAYDGRRLLGNDPHLGRQQQIVLQAFGFSRNEPVVVHRLDDPTFQLTLRADGQGIATYRFRAGHARIADDVVTFEGVDSAPSSNGGGSIQAFVPHFSIFPFRGVG